MLGIYKFLSWLSGTFEEAPGNYGWFHIMFLVIVIAATGLICHCFKNANDKTFRRIVMIAWIVMVIFEIYKEVIFAFHIDEEDLMKDLVAIITSFCCRLYGLRRGYSKAKRLKEELDNDAD